MCVQLERRESLDWIVQGKVQWRAVVNFIMKFLFARKVRNLLMSRIIFIFTRPSLQNNGKGKGHQVTKVQSGSRDIPLLFFLPLELDGVGGQSYAPTALPPGKDPVPTVQDAFWDPGPVCTGAENLARTEIRSPDLPGCSDSLYRLRYPGPLCKRNGVRNRQANRQTDSQQQSKLPDDPVTFCH